MAALVAVIDAATGKALLDTLVNPGPGMPIAPGAFAVHGITDAEVTADGRPGLAPHTARDVVYRCPEP
ncbi:hypothetical protein [Nocardia sp. NPDC004750]